MPIQQLQHARTDSNKEQKKQATKNAKAIPGGSFFSLLLLLLLFFKATTIVSRYSWKFHKMLSNPKYALMSRFSGYYVL